MVCGCGLLQCAARRRCYGFSPNCSCLHRHACLRASGQLPTLTAGLKATSALAAVRPVLGPLHVNHTSSTACLPGEEGVREVEALRVAAQDVPEEVESAGQSEAGPRRLGC